MRDKNTSIAIIGAGLVGSLLGCYLSKRGYQVKVFERRPDIRQAEIDGNRSINLAMSVRGWNALEKVGMKTKLMHIAIPMYGRRIHQTDRTTYYQPYGKEDEAIYSISRGELNKILLEEADKDPNVSLHFNERCTDIDFEANTMQFENYETTRSSSLQTDIVLGTDGAFSAIRYEMQKTPMFNFSQSYLKHGYKELTIPADNNGNHRLDKNALHIWPRKSFMLIALPNLDGSFTCTLFAPFTGEDGFDSIKSDNDILLYFEKHFPTASKHMPTLIEDYKENPTSSLVTVRTDPWHYKNASLLGDSSHAIVPFYGQGMNSGFEDCFVFDQVLENNPDASWPEIFTIFSDERVENANAIADLALRNFIEMRDSTADEKFLLRKKLEQFLAEKFPSRYESQYSMVTFSNKPYSYALNKGDAQIAMLEQLLETYPNQENWDNEVLLKRVDLWLKENE